MKGEKMLSDPDTLRAMSAQQNRFIWYHHLNTRFEIVKSCRFKEMQIIGEGLSIRWLNVQHVKIWDSVRSHLNIDGRAANIYRSLDYYDRIPLMTFNLHKRQEDYNKWSDERSDHIQGTDFGIDIDCKNGSWKDAIPDAEILIKLFNQFDVRYSYWMSGSHGFHFIIPWDDLPNNLKELPYPSRIAFFSKFAGILAEKAHNIDLSIYMATRVLKCPYTLDKLGHVILPLDRKEFELLKSQGETILDPLAVIKRHKLGNRGEYLQGSMDGIKKMIKEWNGWD